MTDNKFTHIDSDGNPSMVDVGSKAVSQRIATARSTVQLPEEVISMLDNKEIVTKKGPVFQTAILAGIMAAKKNVRFNSVMPPASIE